ncbi:MAG: sugar phosphate isomerase/epimerase [Eubacteriales bacterium]|nr:sugar phosphate isomerase/epimerase [Eubacteriales bacterium]
MKYCIAIGEATSPTTPLLLGGDYFKSIETAKALGFEAVEIHTPNPQELEIDKLTETCKRIGMSIETIGTGILYGRYGFYLMDQDTEKRIQLLSMIRNYIDIAARLKSRVTIGSIKGNVPKGENKDKYLCTLAESLKTVSVYAAEKNVILLIEATNRYENNVLNTASDLYRMISENKLKNTMALMDSFHINIEEKSIGNCLSDAREYLGYIHFGDNTRCYPGSGAFDFDVFCSSIKKIGYDGTVSVECYPQPDSLTAAKKTIEFFRKHFS